jgi:hypothetical protein
LPVFASLRVVAATLKGYDNFDGGACARRSPRIVYHDQRSPPTANGRQPGAARLGLCELVAASEVTVVAIPIAHGTRWLLGSAMLRPARPGAFVANVGRDSVVDEAAIADALENGTRLSWRTRRRPAQRLGLPAGIRGRMIRNCSGGAKLTPRTIPILRPVFAPNRVPGT